MQPSTTKERILHRTSLALCVVRILLLLLFMCGGGGSQMRIYNNISSILYIAAKWASQLYIFIFSYKVHAFISF